MGILYRVRQFLNAVREIPSLEDIEQIKTVLAPELFSLFRSMQPGEQAHSIKIWRGLLDFGQSNPDLQVAALLHDVGKTLHPLSVWDRSLIVFMKTLFPKQAKAWGQPKQVNQQPNWRRAFLVAENHPAWGASMAEKAGASPLTVALIRNHQAPNDQTNPPLPSDINDLLVQLIRLDNIH